MSDFKVIYEEFKIQGKDLVEKLKALVHEGNIRRIIIKDHSGNTFLEIPVTVAAVGIIAAPVLAAIGAIAALVSDFTIVVEKSQETPKS
ncbi:MAG: DUF4342 domain-containing protein [Terriglobia bacterium]